jgi:uncharacterized protein YbjT (DUF2867 family)
MNTTRKIAVAGATGRVGRHVVAVAEERGVEVVPMARSLGVDVITCEGLAEALAGVDCVIDAAAGGPSPEPEAAIDFFTRSARNLHDFGTASGVQRMVVVSIIGCDRFSAGYFAANAAHERAVRSGPLPVQILRAAQFHELVEVLIEWGTQGDVSYVPAMRSQLVAARTVAEALVDLATADAANTSAGSPPEIAGPCVENVVDMAQLVEARRGGTRTIVGARDESDPDDALWDAGAQLPVPDARLAGPTFAEWLDLTYGPDAPPASGSARGRVRV